MCVWMDVEKSSNTFYQISMSMSNFDSVYCWGFVPLFRFEYIGKKKEKRIVLIRLEKKKL